MNLIEEVNDSLVELMRTPTVLLLSQLGAYGLGGMTVGLLERFPDQVLTFPVCENLMNGAAMGLALNGFRPIVVHERMDFLAVGMDPLVNHIPIWPYRQKMPMPVTVIAVVGKGHGQGPQHSKNLAPWFRALHGWRVVEPYSPSDARSKLRDAVFGSFPTLYVLHREFFKSEGRFVAQSSHVVKFCGASSAHEKAFYLTTTCGTIS